jgi:hypothetical protein
MNEYAPVSHIPNHSPTLEIGASIQSSPAVQFNLLDMAAQQQQVASLVAKSGISWALTPIHGHI